MNNKLNEMCNFVRCSKVLPHVLVKIEKNNLKLLKSYTNLNDVETVSTSNNFYTKL